MKTKLRQISGQTLLVAVMLATFLVASIPVVVYLSQINAKHERGSEQRAIALAVAEEGVAYAKQILSVDTSTWNNAVHGYSFPSDCVASSAVYLRKMGPVIQGEDGNHFQILCDTAGTQPYQVHIVATALDEQKWLQFSNSTTNPSRYSALRTVEAYVSPLTLALTTSEGVRTSVALQMVNMPTITDLPSAHITPNQYPFEVQWGPIECSSCTTLPGTATSSSWTLTNPLDNKHSGTTQTVSSALVGYPRLFSNGGIAGPMFPRCGVLPCTVTPATDLKQYWAFESLGTSPEINDSTSTTDGYGYIAQHEGASVPIPGGPITSTLGAYYTVTAGTITFAGPTPISSNTFTGLDVSTPTIYVSSGGVLGGGNVQLSHNLIMDLGNGGGALIIEGNLYLDGTAAAPVNPIESVRVPPLADANLEYPYSAPGSNWFCRSSAGTSGCLPNNGTGTPGQLNFRGFLWVKGNIYVNSPRWVFSGVVLVGDPSSETGGLVITTKGTPVTYAAFNLLYDDQINRAIHMQQLILKTDLIRNILAQ